MSLLAGLSQQGDSMTAHNSDPAAHWFTAPLSLVRAFPRNAWFDNRSIYKSGSGAALPSQKEAMTVSTGATTSSICIVGQEPGFGSMQPSNSSYAISVPASVQFSFELAVRTALSGAGTGRLSLGKSAEVDGPGRHAPSFGFEFQPGQVRLFWKTGTAEGESAWFPFADSTTMRLGVFKEGTSLAMYCCGNLLATATSDTAIQIGYDRGFAVEVANGATASDMQMFAGFCQFSVQ